MWALIVPLISSLLGENGPLGQYFKIKSDKIAAEEKYNLAVLQSQAQLAQTDAQQVTDRLSSTSREFKQSTFWFIAFPVVITMCPWTSDFAVTMWANFGLIPQWFQVLFVSVYSSIWGLPIAKEYLGGMFKSLGNAVESRRGYKLEKARINRAAAYEVLRAKMFQKGMTNAQVQVFEEAFDASEKG